MSIFISLSVIFWSLFPSLLSYTQDSPPPNKVHLQNLNINGDLTLETNFNLWTKNAQVIFDNVNSRAIIDTTNAVIFSSPLLSNQPSGQKLYFLLNGYSSSATPINIRYQLDGLFNSQANLITNVPSSRNNFSNIITFNDSFDTFSISRGSVGVIFYLYTFNVFNVSQMIANGVKDDNGVLFSSLTDSQIKTQLDSWVDEIPMAYFDSYYLSTSISDNYKWFTTGFVDKTGERDFLDYLGFFVWLAVPPISIYLLYKLMKGLLYE